MRLLPGFLLLVSPPPTPLIKRLRFSNINASRRFPLLSHTWLANDIQHSITDFKGILLIKHTHPPPPCSICTQQITKPAAWHNQTTCFCCLHAGDAFSFSSLSLQTRYKACDQMSQWDIFTIPTLKLSQHRMEETETIFSFWACALSVLGTFWA